MATRTLVRGQVTWVRSRARDLRADPIASNSSLLMINGLLNSALGYAFWVIATHIFTPTQVGISNAAISAATLIAIVSDLGMRSLVMTTLPTIASARAWSVEVSASIIVTGASTAIGTVVALVIFHLTGSPIAHAFGGAWGLFLLVLAVTQCWNLLLDGISAAERSTRQIVSRNFALSLLKIAAIVVAGLLDLHSRQTIVACVTIAMAWAAVYGATVQLRTLRSPWRFRVSGVAASVHTVRAKIIGHHVLTLSGYLPIYLTPILVVSIAGEAESAYLTLAWTLGSVFFMVSPSIGSMLFVQGRWEPEALRAALRRSVRLVAMLLLPLAVGAVVLGPMILGWFGSSYASHGYPVLWILAISAVPDAVTNLYTGLLRARERVAEAAAMNAVIAVCAIAAIAALLPGLGIKGGALGWLIGQSAGCLWVLVSAAFRSPLDSDAATGRHRSGD